MINVLKDKLGNILNPIIPRYETITLYDNPDGTTENITLEENLGNYKKIIIETRNDEFNYPIYKNFYFENPNGKSIELSYVITNENGNFLKLETSIYKLEGILITKGENSNVNIMNLAINYQRNTSNIKITKILGYK